MQAVFVAQQRDAAAAIEAAGAKAHAEIAEKRAEAGAAIAQMHAEAQRHLDAATAREAVVRKHAAELAALAQE